MLSSKSKDSKEFDAQAWDQIDFQDKINGLVTKGLLEQLENKKYQISKLGIEGISDKSYLSSSSLHRD